ncbi:MAG: cation-transporting P-type ATPase [Candidatus Brocadiaceae bacterium]|nr:cation-transporting P-type ATPase [Candidatus Brocadiaceae bacterium]
MFTPSIQGSGPPVHVMHAEVKGRARYKVNGLERSPLLKRLIEMRLQEKDGIDVTSASVLTGNVLVIFNSGNSTAIIASLLKDIVSEYREKGCTVTENNHSSDLNTSVQRPGPMIPNSGTITSRIKNAFSSKRKPVVQIRGAEEQKAESWHLMDADPVIAAWKTSGASGLSIERAQENLKRYGPNALPECASRSGFKIFLDQLKSLPVALLCGAAALSLFTGGIVDAVAIMGVVAINAVIGYVTESQSEKTIHSLKRLVRPSAQVIRNRELIEIPSEQVVPGDLLVLKPGSFIPADGRILETNQLCVDESALTGESMPVLKNPAVISARNDIPLADRRNMVYMGTMVTGGFGLSIVVATGTYTEMGMIQTMVGEATTPETPMEKQLKRLGNQLVIVCGAVCGGVLIAGLLRGYGFIQMLKSSISLAVSAVPEGLPTISTTTLALGIKNMRRRKVLIRQLNAVEALGCVQTICLDKTGTLTLNRMSVVALYSGMQHIKVSDGRFIGEKEHINPFSCDELLRLIHISILCNETEINREGEEFILNGSSTENALIHLAISSGVDISEIRKRYPNIKVNYRSENRNFMSTIHETGDTEANGTSRLLVALKGSPGEVLSLCSWHLHNGTKKPLTEDDRNTIETENERMAGNALRVLGIAFTYISRENHEDYHVHNGLTWLGLIGMTDPLRYGMKEVIHDFHQAGIQTAMITGDQSTTAYVIGKELRLSNDEPLEILDSTHLTEIKPEVRPALFEKINIFARVSPSHKLNIVQSLQKAGKVVAMTGDGINDGPALKAANIGVAMGHSGTDVAREVADVILEDDNIETMIIAVSQGRTIHNNIRKSLHFLLSTNMSEIIVMFTAIAGGIGQPLNAMQLLWINLISDIFPGLALALEPPEPDILKQPPRPSGEPIVKLSDLRKIAVESSVISAATLGSYGYGIRKYGIGPRASTLAFTTLTAGELLHAISCRSEKHSIFDTMKVNGRQRLQPNNYLTIALGGSFALQAMITFLPGLRTFLGTTSIGVLDGAVIGGNVLFSFIINELLKTRSIERKPSGSLQKVNPEGAQNNTEAGGNP